MDKNIIFDDLNESMVNLLMFANDEGIDVNEESLYKRIDTFANDRNLIMSGSVVNKFETTNELILTLVVSCFNEESRKIDMTSIIIKKVYDN